MQNSTHIRAAAHAVATAATAAVQAAAAATKLQSQQVYESTGLRVYESARLLGYGTFGTQDYKSTGLRANECAFLHSLARSFFVSMFIVNS